ncbi:lytic murein transglycosylase [Micromonospora musae]|uniref:lytic transglycosylase domain-containing protein n=1 Tax=Micromonospora musae TaxID=1894970 RepID=UPI003437414D
MPERALAAYAGASLAEAQKNPGCHLGWNTLAAIGQVESAHGTLGGATTGVDGVATPAIIGRALDGHGVAKIPDTDHGRLDGDTTWDHAVGPLQFTPATWATHAQDGNHDGVTDINNIDDAALAAAGYLCRSGDLTVARNWIAAVTAYNPDPAYTNKVADAANSYAPVG